MKFLFMSNEGKSADVALRLKREGHEVVYWIRKQQFKTVFDGLLHKADHWGHYLEPERVVVFDSVGGGKTAERLRKQGFKVWGATEEGDMKSADPTICGVEIPEVMAINYRNFLDGELVFAEGFKVDIDWIGGRVYKTVGGITREIEDKTMEGEKERAVCMTFIQTPTGKKPVGYTANLPVAIAAIQRLGKVFGKVVSGEGEFEKTDKFACRLPIFCTRQHMNNLNFPSDFKEYYHFANIAVVDGHISTTGANRKLVDLVAVGDKWEELVEEVERVARELPFKEKLWKEIDKKVVEEGLKDIR